MAPATEIIDFELERGRHGSLLGREDVLTELDALLLGGPLVAGCWSREDPDWARARS